MESPRSTKHPDWGTKMAQSKSQQETLFFPLIPNPFFWLLHDQRTKQMTIHAHLTLIIRF